MKRFILITVILLVASAAPILPQTQSGQLAGVIQEGRRAAAFAMIQAGADVNEAQLDGTRPIHWAVYRVDYDLVDALIARKARVDVANEFGHTPLAEAVKQGDARMVKTLLSAGSGTEGANEDGQTALMVAIKNGDLPIFQMLIDAGAKVNVVEKVQDQTPLMWAAAATRNAAEMVEGADREGRHCECSRQVQRLAEPDYLGASRSISRVRRTHSAPVRRSRRLLRLRGSAGGRGCGCESADAGRRQPDHDCARQRPQQRRQVVDGSRR